MKFGRFNNSDNINIYMNSIITLILLSAILVKHKLLTLAFADWLT